ncbi:MAG: DUF2752 domain-containing protein [Chitinophagaceae bacterium]
MFNKPTIIIATAAVGVILLYYFLDARLGLLPACPFYLISNLYCPGCGSQRALSSLLHGDFSSAASYNFLFFISIPFLGYSVFSETLSRLLKRPASGNLFYSPLFSKIVLMIIVCFWILRNISVYPFNLLAPHK